MTSAAIRHKLYDYIRFADDKKVRSIYNLLKKEIETPYEWWKDKQFIKELDKISKAMENGTEKGITLEELETAINKLRVEEYGNQP